MREIIVNLKEIGKTIMLSSHLLPELGTICDLVAIVAAAELRAFGTVEEVTANLKEEMRFSLTVDGSTDIAQNVLQQIENVSSMACSHNEIIFNFNGARSGMADIISLLVQNGVRIVSVSEEEINLEAVFMKVTAEA